MFWPNPTAGYQGYQPDIKAFCIGSQKSVDRSIKKKLGNFGKKRDTTKKLASN